MKESISSDPGQISTKPPFYGTGEQYSRYTQGENVDWPEPCSNFPPGNFDPKNAALSLSKGPVYPPFPSNYMGIEVMALGPAP